MERPVHEPGMLQFMHRQLQLQLAWPASLQRFRWMAAWLMAQPSTEQAMLSTNPESTVFPVVTSRSKAGVPDAGCLADGTPIELAGNRSLKFFHPAKTSLVADVHELARTAGEAEKKKKKKKHTT